MNTRTYLGGPEKFWAAPKSSGRPRTFWAREARSGLRLPGGLRRPRKVRGATPEGPSTRRRGVATLPDTFTFWAEKLWASQNSSENAKHVLGFDSLEGCGGRE